MKAESWATIDRLLGQIALLTAILLSVSGDYEKAMFSIALAIYWRIPGEYFRGKS